MSGRTFYFKRARLRQIRVAMSTSIVGLLWVSLFPSSSAANDDVEETNANTGIAAADWPDVDVVPDLGQSAFPQMLHHNIAGAGGGHHGSNSALIELKDTTDTVTRGFGGVVTPDAYSLNEACENHAYEFQRWSEKTAKSTT